MTDRILRTWSIKPTEEELKAHKAESSSSNNDTLIYVNLLCVKCGEFAVNAVKEEDSARDYHPHILTRYNKCQDSMDFSKYDSGGGDRYYEFKRMFVAATYRKHNSKTEWGMVV